MGNNYSPKTKVPKITPEIIRSATQPKTHQSSVQQSFRIPPAPQVLNQRSKSYNHNSKHTNNSAQTQNRQVRKPEIRKIQQSKHHPHKPKLTKPKSTETAKQTKQSLKVYSHLVTSKPINQIKQIQKVTDNKPEGKISALYQPQKSSNSKVNPAPKHPTPKPCRTKH